MSSEDAEKTANDKKPTAIVALGKGSGAQAKDAAANDPADQRTAEADTAEADTGEDTDAQTPSSGVAEKARARAQARAAAAAADREFTISTRTIKRAVVGIFAIAVVAVACVFGWKWYDTEQKLAAFDDSKAAAAHYITEYFGVLLKEGATADQLKAKIGPLSTGDQKAQIEESASNTVQWRDTQKLANVETKVNSTMVESFSRDHAVTVVSFEFTGTSAVAPGGGKAVTLIQVTLDKVDGDWLASNLQAVPGMAGEAAPGDTQQPVPAMPTQQPTQPAQTQPVPNQPAG